MPAREGRKQAPAALVLGVLAGIVAAVAVLPMAIPITMQLAEAERTMSLRYVEVAAAVTAERYEDSGTLLPGTQAQLQVDHVHISDKGGRVILQDGVALPPDVGTTACSEGGGSRQLTTDNGTRWVTACVAAADHFAIAAWRAPRSNTWGVTLLVLALSAIVGLVTALGVLRLLAPLSRVSAALDRVGAGERSVSVPSTGMAELDTLVDHLNAAAQSVAKREEDYLSNIQAVQEMARMVAHEVRNPLQSLELLTSLIVAEETEAERDELARAIHQEIRTLDMVVDRVLREGVNGAGGLQLQKSHQSLRPLVEQVIKIRTPEARANGIRLEVGDLPDTELDMDMALLGRSVENLVLNAMQAVPPRRGHIRVSGEVIDNQLCIYVEDNGPGVPAAFGDHIYETNVSGRTGGTGLGLALVKGVIEAHGGYIAHDRSPLGGARFKAQIPLGEVDGGA